MDAVQDRSECTPLYLYKLSMKIRII